MKNDPGFPSIDPAYYKWRVIAGIATLALDYLAVILTSVGSASQSKESIMALHAMGHSVAFFVIFFIFRYPPEKGGRYTMNNPWIALIVGVVVTVVGALMSTAIGRLVP
jgi:hypothetical protein